MERPFQQHPHRDILLGKIGRVVLVLEDLEGDDRRGPRATTVRRSLQKDGFPDPIRLYRIDRIGILREYRVEVLTDRVRQAAIQQGVVGPGQGFRLRLPAGIPDYYRQFRRIHVFDEVLVYPDPIFEEKVLQLQAAVIGDRLLFQLQTILLGVKRTHRPDDLAPVQQVLIQCKFLAFGELQRRLHDHDRTEFRRDQWNTIQRDDPEPVAAAQSFDQVIDPNVQRLAVPHHIPDKR